MVNFDYCAPTRVVFGRGMEEQTGSLTVDALGGRGVGRTVLLHFGEGSAKKSGLLDRVKASLAGTGMRVLELGGVKANPVLSLVREGVALCKAESVDFVLAVGGGSAIDSAKAIAYGALADVDAWDFYVGKAKPKACLPLGVVLTIAAAGSEMSNSSVITNEGTEQKRGLNNEICRPKFAVMNPELTYTLPPYQTAAGCADILMHTLERYFTPETPTMQLTDGIAETLMRTVMENARILMREPKNYKARAEIMWAGSLSHNGLTGCGGGGGDWATHQLSHELSGKYDLAHGAALTAVWGSWARYVYLSDAARFARLAENVLDLPVEGDEEDMAKAAIEEMEAFFWAIEMPTSISEAGIELSAEDIKELAQRCSWDETRTIGGLKALDRHDIQQIYTMAK